MVNIVSMATEKTLTIHLKLDKVNIGKNVFWQNSCCKRDPCAKYELCQNWDERVIKFLVKIFTIALAMEMVLTTNSYCSS